MNSEQLAVKSEQLAVKSEQLAVSKERLAVKSEQLAVSSEQSSLFTVHCSQPTDDCSAVLRVVGTALAEDRPLELEAGWNLVSFLPRAALPVTTALASLEGQYLAVLGYEGGALSYYPDLDPSFNTLQVLAPQRGYWIKMKQAGTLRYPVNSEQYSVHSDDCSLLTAHCSLFTAHCSLLTVHCPLFTAHSPPLLARFNTSQRPSPCTPQLKWGLTVRQKAIIVTKQSSFTSALPPGRPWRQRHPRQGAISWLLTPLEQAKRCGRWFFARTARQASLT
ncbi:MAG TPA: hypothetical protein DEP84_00040 [Chloroflexi bacterium]|nr:hypothetical protein [Chloroflexota bacterium]